MINIAKAILKAQKEMGNAVKDAKNPFFKSSYADLNAVREAVLPALNAAGISVLQPTVTIDGRQYVRTTLLHESGESFTSDTEIVTAKQNDPQAMGSAISYARRYGLQSLMCVGAVDDDGEKSMGRDTVTTKIENKPVITAKPVSTSAQTAAKIEASTTSNSGTSPGLKTPAPFKMKPKTTTSKVTSDDGI